MDETIAVERLCGANSLHSSPPSTCIPLDIIQEQILCRLPVKSLLRFRCVCNSWNHLISKDLKFAKKHLRVSPKPQHLVTTIWRQDEELTVMSCPFDSLNLHSNFDSKSTRLDYSPIIENPWEGLVASCDGILCFSIDECLAVLYNPSIKKVTKLPSIHLPREVGTTRYAFGYDPFIDNYKVVAVFSHYNNYEAKVKVHSYTLGTDSWKRIKNFPSRFSDPFGTSNSKHGIFMRGTVNWLTFSESTDSDAIVSLHLGMESYQEISLPNLSDGMLTLYVMRDCLCVFVISKDRNVKEEYFFTDVWLMKEYGNKESWIKLCRIPFFGKYDFHTDIVYISEDNNHVLSRNSNFNWIIYNLKNNTTTINNSKTHDNLGWVKSKVYVESLISP